MSTKEALAIVALIAVFAAAVAWAYERGRTDEMKRRMRQRMDCGKTRQEELAK